MLSQAEITNRIPVWRAMSDLFLDTESSPGDYSALAQVLARADLSQSELKDIFLHEIAPAFYPNLMSVAGEWQPWDEDQARDIVLASMRSARAFPSFFWLRRWLSRGYARGEWEKILASWPKSRSAV